MIRCRYLWDRCPTMTAMGLNYALSHCHVVIMLGVWLDLRREKGLKSLIASCEYLFTRAIHVACDGIDHTSAH